MTQKGNHIIDEAKKLVYADAKLLNKKEMKEIKKLTDKGYKMLPMKEWENR